MLRRQTGGRAIRDVGMLVGGTLGARTIAVLAMPLLTRLFEPAVFGRAAFVIAVATTLSPAGSLGYDQAILLPPQREMARRLSQLAALALALMTLVLAVLAPLAWPRAWLPNWMAGSNAWWWLIALMVLLLGVCNIFAGWTTRQQAYRAMAGSVLIEGATSAAGRIGWGLLLMPGPAGLLTPYIAAIALRAWVLMRAIDHAAPEDDASGSASSDLAAERNTAIGTGGELNASLLAVAGRYRNFPLFGLPSQLMRSIADRIPLLLLGAVFAPAVVGYFAAASRLIQAPVQSFTQAVRRVVFQRAVHRRRESQPVLDVVVLATLGLAVLGGPPFLLLALEGERIMAFVLGADWARAGLFAEAVSLWGFTMFCLGPPTAVFQALERQQLLLVIASLRGLAFALVASVVVTRHLEPMAAVEAFALAGTLTNLVQAGAGLALAVAYDHRARSEP
jgi:O-antigen/teichoic acid export membrane protein